MYSFLTKNYEQKIDVKDSSEIGGMIPLPKLIALYKIVIEDSSFDEATCGLVLNMFGYCLVF